MTKALPSVSLDDVLMTETLAHRSPRTPDLQTENQALHTLARQLAEQPQSMLKTLVTVAKDLCQAGTAGVSLLEVTPDGEESFRWHVLAGALAGYEGETTPRNFSPCGICLDRQAPQLYFHPERYFTDLQQAHPAIVEGLVLPLIVANQPLGTIWIVSHDEARQFDAEDVRLLTSLADFTAAALHSMQLRQTAEAALQHEQTARQTAELSLRLEAERQQAETALQEAHVQLESALAAGSVYTWRWNIPANRVVVNAAFAALFGVDPAVATTAGLPLEVFIHSMHEEDRPRVSVAIQEAIATGEDYAAEYRVQTGSGEERWLRARGRVEYDAAGLPIAFPGALADITDRKQAEAALRASEERFRNMANNAPVTVWVTDSTGYCTYLSQSWYDFTGQTEATGLGFGWLNVVHPEDIEAAKTIFLASNERQEAFRLEYRLRCQDGDYRWAINAAKPWFGVDGAFKGYIGSIIDISDRKQAEVALAQREAELRLVTNAVPALIAFVDADQRYRFNNRGYEAWFGRSATEIYGKPVREVLGEAAYAGIRPYIEQVLSGQQVNFEHQVPHQAGGTRYVNTTYVPRFDAQGGVEGFVALVNDISERKQAEAALRQSESRYRTLFESIDEGFCVVEVLLDADDTPIDYRVLEVNPIFEQQTGLQQAVGKTARQLKLEAHWIEIYGRVALTGEAIRFENGSESLQRWFDVYACCTGEPEERKVAIVFKDISERKRAEAKARQTAEANAFRVSLTDVLRPLVDPLEMQAMASRVLGEYLGANRVAYFEVRDADYVVERDYVNGAAGLAGRYPIASFGPKLLAAFRAGHTVPVSNVPADPNLSPEQRLAYATLEIGAHISVPLVKEGLLVAGLAVHMSEARVWTPDEIALAEEVAERTWAAVERARAEAALRQSEEKSRNILESIAESFFALDQDWRFTYMNQSAEALLGRTLSDLIGKNIWDEYPGLAGNELESAYRGAMHERVAKSLTAFYPNHDRWYEVRAYPAANGIAVYFNNVTARKAAEAEREQLLQQEQAARAEAQRANRIKDEFLAVLSHELRSPLNPILGWTQLLQNGKLNAARQAEALKTIERNAKLQAQLIEDLLDISRIMQGKLFLTVMPVSLASVIAAALETVQLAAEAKNIAIVLDLDPDVAPVSGDAVRLQQVVWNLLTNAVKFTDNGGQVTVELSRVAAAGSLDHTMAQIRVIDRGKGISPQFLPHVFEYFRQEDGSTTRRFGGLGLGLAIVRQIVELHGGTVAAESGGEQQGATFVVQLPTLPQAAPVLSESTYA